MDDEPRLTEEQKEYLQTELMKSDYANKDVQQAYDYLHLPYSVTTEHTRSVPLTIQGALAAISKESAAKLASNPNVTDLRDKVLSQDIAGVTLWVMLFAAGGVITPEEAQALSAALGQTETYETMQMFPPRIGKAFLRLQMPNAIRFDDFEEVFKLRAV